MVKPWLLALHVVVTWGQETPAPVDFDEGRMSDQTKDDFALLFDEGFMQQMVDCQQVAGDGCDVTTLVENMVEVGQKLENIFRNRPFGLDFRPADCKDFWSAFEDNPRALRSACSAAANWPGVCTVFYRGLLSRVASDTWELAVMCRMIDPGLDDERMPTCATLATMTAVNRPTLHDGGCAFATREECITNLCDTYAQFGWRMHPRNLIPENFKSNFGYEDVLAGCENLTKLELYNSRETCPDRVDVISFCDCICPAMPSVRVLGTANCPLLVDSYLLFGRLGITNVTFDGACEAELCSVFESQRLTAGCADSKLPGEMECIGMQIPQVMPENSPCPWLNHSGAENILECLSGHRCNIVDEGWDCCADHRGRAKCPMQLPVMCDTICSGFTEYCCKEEGQCSERGCPVVLRRDFVYQQHTTTTSTTTPPGGEGAAAEGQFTIRLPAGAWVWLLVLIPCGAGLVFYIYIRCRQVKVHTDSEAEDTSIMGMKLDHFGFFKAYKAENREREAVKPRVCIVMSDLPDTRPLGLELVELRVIRVHPWGAKHGWQVGDIIVDIGGVPVNTFEELWERIQVERNRPPVRFTVERWNVAATVEEERAANALEEDFLAKQMKKQVEEDRQRRSKTRVASKQIVEAQAATTRPLGPNVPASFDPDHDQGWEEEDYEDDYSFYSEDSAGVPTVNFPTGRYKSRFAAVFELLEEKSEAASRPGTPAVTGATGAKPETKPEKHVPDPERRTFYRDKVTFTKDAWGRSVVKVLNPSRK